MKNMIIIFILFSFNVWAENFTDQLESVQHVISKQELDSYLEKPSIKGVPGLYFSSLLPSETIDPKTNCDIKDEPKNTGYEVVLVAEGNTKMSSLEILPGQSAQLKTEDLMILHDHVYETPGQYNLNSKDLLARSKYIYEKWLIRQPSPYFDPKSPLGREVFIESLVHASARSGLSEGELTKSMATIISDVYKTDDEKYQALSALSLRLYRNYNNSRNPGYNNPKNNPFNDSIPEGDMTANQLLKAASDFNVFQGGVCNDITEVVAMVGERLFPDKDVLTVQAGSHFGVLITDGKEHRIINGGNEMKMSNHLFLDPVLPSSNMRISKMQNGALKEIAVVDTEMGQVTEAAFQTGKHLLKTDADVSTIMAHMKKENFGVTLGTAHLTDSNVVIVVAKYENSNDKWKGYVGAGLSAQNFATAQDTSYQVHFRAGVERNIFRYINSKTELSFDSGLRLAGAYGLTQPDDGSIAKVDMSGAFDFYNRINYVYGKNNTTGMKVKSYVEVEHTLGPTNWGNTTGALSYMGPKDTGTILKNMSFHLNQVNADVTAEKPLSSKVTAIGNTHYQGSNIGQSVSVLAGLNIRVPAGAQLLVFAGYTNAEIGGYKTKYSLLGTPSGAQVGVKYITKGGVEVGAAVKSISNKPSVNATVKIPLGKKPASSQ